MFRVLLHEYQSKCGNNLSLIIHVVVYSVHKEAFNDTCRC